MYRTMKNWKSFFASFLAIGVLAGCSKSNDIPQPGPGGSDDAAYMSVQVALPTAKNTRSKAAGTEVGQDYENKVQKLMLVLAKSDNSYVAHGVVENVTKQTGSTVTTTAKINRTSIFNFYEKGDLTGDQNRIRVFVFCNPTDALIASMSNLTVGDKEWCDLTGMVDEEQADIWYKNSFLMANSEIAVKQIPVSFDDWVTRYANEGTPFDLSGDNNGSVDNKGAVKVERVSARFDFCDGSPESSAPHTYDIGEGDDAGTLQVQLVRMALVNMNNSFYYLRRVSADGMPAGAELCGEETADNYVVSTAHEIKTQDQLAEQQIAELNKWFSYCLYDTKGQIDDLTRQQWDSYWIDDVMGRDEDNDEGWTADRKSGYHIWRYVTENTIPMDNKYQRTGVSTGVVFKGKLLAGDKLDKTSDLYKAISDDIKPGDFDGYTYQVDDKSYPILYLFQNQLYTGWNREVATEAAKDPHSDLYKAAMTAPEGQKSPDALYKELVEANKEGARGHVNEALAAFRKAATAAGFTLYQASNDADGIADGKHAGVGYYFYYFYWNRHNDNYKPGAMGQMEFGTVRNNVYKLAVTGIRKLGHPRNTDNDPDPVDPDDPDENGDIYLKVSVEVLPWTVRVNNIDF